MNLIRSIEQEQLKDDAVRHRERLGRQPRSFGPDGVRLESEPQAKPPSWGEIAE